MPVYNLDVDLPAAIIAQGPAAYVIDADTFIGLDDVQSMLDALDIELPANPFDPIPDQGAVVGTLTKVSTTGSASAPDLLWGSVDIHAEELSRLQAAGILVAP